MIIECTHCHTRVIVDDSRICPSCQKVNAAREDEVPETDRTTLPGTEKEAGHSTPSDGQCPHCHVPMKPWRGKDRCWECGYPDKKEPKASNMESTEAPTLGARFLGAVVLLVGVLLCWGYVILQETLSKSIHPMLALVLGLVAGPLLASVFSLKRSGLGCLLLTPLAFVALLLLQIGLNDLGAAGATRFHPVVLGRVFIGLGWMMLCLLIAFGVKSADVSHKARGNLELGFVCAVIAMIGGALFMWIFRQ